MHPSNKTRLTPQEEVKEEHKKVCELRQTILKNEEKKLLEKEERKRKLKSKFKKVAIFALAGLAAVSAYMIHKQQSKRPIPQIKLGQILTPQVSKYRPAATLS